jgi:hypothetical protein
MPIPTRTQRPLLRLMLAVGLMCLVPGCSYVLLLGYLIGGPPSIEPAFDAETKESMTDKDVTVAVVCYAPDDVRYNFENIDEELARYVAFRLIQKKIEAINPDRVKMWLTSNPEWDEPEEIGSAFKTTYVIYIDLNDFTLYEDGSASLYRGKAEAIVSVWKMDDAFEEAEKIFSKEKISKFPQHRPIAATEETYSNFKARYLTRLSEEIGRLFYEYYIADEIIDAG